MQISLSLRKRRHRKRKKKVKKMLNFKIKFNKKLMKASKG